MELAQQTKPQLWKNQRIINEKGLVQCQPRERLFDNSECAVLFEDLLKIYQQKGLKMHYVNYALKKSVENETITYKCYVDYRCAKKDVNAGKKRMVGEFFVHYRIIRISPQTVLCSYPYLLLFDLSCGEQHCPDCQEYHLYKITQSSFYVIRTQFIYELIRKIAFMSKYPTYNFTPHSFESKESAGDTIYEYVKDHNYEPSYYFERCENSLANLLKLQMLKREMDCQTVRLDLLCQGNLELVEKYKKTMLKHTSFFKLKYMCRKCPGKEIWTTRDSVTIHFGIYQLEPLFKERLLTIKDELQKCIFEGSQIQAKYRQLSKKCMNLATSSEERISIQKLFKIENRRLDRSVQQEYEQFQEFQKDIESFYAYHKDIESYKWPYLIVFSIKVPKMNCRRCQKEKDGLIYITNLVDEAHNSLNNKIITKIREMKDKKALAQKHDQ